MTLSVEVHNLKVRYGDFAALSDLSFSLEGGKIYGLLGRNGAGKTTLLSVLAAFRKATAGSVRIDGQDPFENAEIMRQTCFIQEKVHAVKEDSVKDALEFVADLRPNWDQEYAEHLLKRFDLPLDTSIENLSRGMQSSVGAILGLASRAPLTMFDETYLGMDAPTRYIFYEELLNDYMEHPRTIVISSHLIQEVEPLLEDVIIIDKGRLVLHEEVDTLRSRGAAVTGPAEAVDTFVDGMTVLSERRLGGTKSTTVYGSIEPEHRQQATALGLDLEPVALQDLFVHLTGNEENA